MSTTKVTDNLRETTEVDATKITTGTIPEARITSLDATKLTGTIADARFPATLPAISGANLTNLPATADEITKSTSEPTGTTNPSGGVGTIWLRTTTGEMYCCTDATTNANVWTNIGDGTGNQPVVYTVATGGTITTDGDYKVHTFDERKELRGIKFKYDKAINSYKGLIKIELPPLQYFHLQQLLLPYF